MTAYITKMWSSRDLVINIESPVHGSINLSTIKFQPGPDLESSQQQTVWHQGSVTLADGGNTCEKPIYDQNFVQHILMSIYTPSYNQTECVIA